jgi:5-methyltetrahydrofolate--homocysteine methyltransferase
MTASLIHAMVEMQEAEALRQARALLDAGADPRGILAACSQALELVGRRFEKGEYFLPHLLMAGEMMKQVSAMLAPLLTAGPPRAGRGRVLIGTVRGDIHDIGKNIVAFLLEANGFAVRDIGVDRAPEQFVEAIADFRPQVVGMSGLLTVAFDAMQATVQAIEAAGLRPGLKIMIGGAQVSEQVRDYTGADAWGADAVAGVALARSFVGEAADG